MLWLKYLLNIGYINLFFLKEVLFEDFLGFLDNLLLIFFLLIICYIEGFFFFLYNNNELKKFVKNKNKLFFFIVYVIDLLCLDKIYKNYK